MSTNATKIESILNKITSLRNLANKAGTRAEAEAAAAHAERLISEYHIEEAQLEAASTALPVEHAEESDYLHSWEGQAKAWIGLLGSRLAELHGCCAVETGSGGESFHGGIRIAGRASDVAIVRYLFGWLVYEIDRLSQREHGRAAKNAFRQGAVMGFYAAMKRAQETAFAPQQSGKTSTAMVLTDRTDLARRVFTSKGLHIRNAKSTTHDGEARARGLAAGANLSPTAGLNVGTPVRMLGR